MRTLAVLGLISANLAFIVISNIGLKWSALSHEWRGFLWWQAVGNAVGFLGTLTFTFLLRFISLHHAYAVTLGLGFVLVQVIAARLVFHETITMIQWLGTALITVGIVLVSLGQ